MFDRQTSTTKAKPRKASAAAIGEILGAANQDVQELNAIMHNKYACDPGKLRTWQSASRAGQAPVREKKVGGTTRHACVLAAMGTPD